MPYNLPDIRLYDDLPSWLRAVTHEGRVGLGAEGSRLSQGWIRQQVLRRRPGPMSEGTLSNIWNGRRNLGLELAKTLAEVLDLEGEQRDCYFDQVTLQAPRLLTEDDEMRRRTRLQAARLRAVGDPLGDRDVGYLGDRHLIVLHALISTADFRPEPKWIASRLREGPPPETVPALLEKLLDLGAAEVDASGRWHARTLKLDRRVADADQRKAIIAFHEVAADRACKAMKAVPSAHRHIQTTVFAVASDEVPTLKDRLAQLISEFDRPRGPDAPADAVYQVQVSLVPLTEA